MTKYTQRDDSGGDSGSSSGGDSGTSSGVSYDPPPPPPPPPPPDPGILQAPGSINQDIAEVPDVVSGGIFAAASIHRILSDEARTSWRERVEQERSSTPDQKAEDAHEKSAGDAADHVPHDHDAGHHDTEHHDTWASHVEDDRSTDHDHGWGVGD